jgi:hypothetical protein
MLKSYNIPYIKRVKNLRERKILQKKLNFSNYLQHKKTINYYFLLDKMFIYDIIKTDIKIFLYHNTKQQQKKKGKTNEKTDNKNY